jgi:hypothetical protein
MDVGAGVFAKAAVVKQSWVSSERRFYGSEREESGAGDT